jgi:methionyl-tRNA formyltransferase
VTGAGQRPPRVLYLGYGEVGRACLADLLAAGFEIVGVLCRASDRSPAGGASSVFRYAGERGLHRFAATDPSSAAFLAEASDLAPDLLLSIQYDRILKPPLLAIPRHGSFNLHFGPLPRLRGCFPTKWAILDDEPAGVTFHHIDPGIDSGDVIAQTIVPLAADETDESLYHKLERAAVPLFREQLAWMRELRQPPCLPQEEEKASYHPKAIPYGGVIDWSREAVWVERFLRAFTFPPYPAARTGWNGEEVQLRAPVAISGDLPGRSPGEIVPRGEAVAVCCGEGSLLVERAILAGEERPATFLVAGGEPRPRFGEPPP